jgi:hypothetical protein
MYPRLNKNYNLRQKHHLVVGIMIVIIAGFNDETKAESNLYGRKV